MATNWIAITLTEARTMANFITPPQLRARLPLPPRPDTHFVRLSAATRLHAIETEVLPALGEQRKYLERLWRSDASDSVPLYVDAGHALLTHPAGATRLADVLAEEHAMATEAESLRALVTTLDAYDAGGAEFVDTEVTPRPTARSAAAEFEVFSEQAYTRWLLGYLLEVRKEIWAARKHGDSGLREQLDLEFTELQKRIQTRSAGMRALASAVCAGPLPRSA